MTELCTLHLLDTIMVDRYLAAVTGRTEPETVVPWAAEWSERVVHAARVGYERARVGQEQGANAISFGLAQVLATVQPTYVLPSAGLTAWEARIDRGIGMLLRPPSRLFGEAGLPIAIARTMPIRLDLAAGMMGGSHIPARLIPDLQRQLDARLERLVRRMVEAELDGVALLALMMEATNAAAAQNLGLFEALDVITPEVPEADPPGAQVVMPNRKRIEPALRRRLEEAAKPPKKPGLMARLFGRRVAT